jgi:hypothetical protein
MYVLQYNEFEMYVVCIYFVHLRYLGLFGDHIVPAVLYHYTQVHTNYVHVQDTVLVVHPYP